MRFSNPIRSNSCLPTMASARSIFFGARSSTWFSWTWRCRSWTDTRRPERFANGKGKQDHERPPSLRKQPMPSARRSRKQPERDATATSPSRSQKPSSSRPFATSRLPRTPKAVPRDFSTARALMPSTQGAFSTRVLSFESPCSNMPPTTLSMLKNRHMKRPIKLFFPSTFQVTIL